MTIEAGSTAEGAGRRIHLQEVGTRDGLQAESAFVPTEDKIALVDALSEAGLSKIEVTAFVSPKAIPALRDAEQVLREIHRERSLGHDVPVKLEIGAMLETPSLAYAPRAFFEMTDFVSIGGNDLKQFFFAADRENERVRRRYDILNVSFLHFLRHIVGRCEETGTALSFCGEDAGRPVEALAFAALGIRGLSMRPASIGPVKALFIQNTNPVNIAPEQGLTRAGGSSTQPETDHGLHHSHAKSDRLHDGDAATRPR